MHKLSMSSSFRGKRVLLQSLVNSVDGRTLILSCGVGLVAFALTVQLLRLHGGFVKTPVSPSRGDKTAEKMAVRGRIYDRNGKKNILAMDAKKDAVRVSPKTIIRTNQLMLASYEIAQSLRMSQAAVLEKINKPECGYVVVCAETPIDQAMEMRRRIKEKKLSGIQMAPAKTRLYPQSDLMGAVIGHVTNCSVGSSGVELMLNRMLSGTMGFDNYLVDAVGNARQKPDGGTIAALQGADVFLNLDVNIQHIVETALKDAVEAYDAAAACAIVQDPRTGAILAMGSYPGYDLNNITHDDIRKKHTLNRAIEYMYEPGSTFKAIVFAAALNEKLVTPDTVIDCENGAWTYNGRVLHDFHPYGLLTVADGIKKSSNIMAAKLAIMLGKEKLCKYLRDFSVGEKLGVDLPFEARGSLRDPSTWCGIDITRIPMGQGVSVTALQLLGIYCAIANDGKIMKPRVVNRVTDTTGAVLMKPRQEVLSQPISAETAATMRRLLARVTEEGGTGIKARVEGFEVAGKTGSAQKIVGRTYQAYVASFVGFFPAENPELAIVVMVDEPKVSHLGGTVAGPAFSRIGTMAARYLEMQTPRARLAMRKSANNESRQTD